MRTYPGRRFHGKSPRSANASDTAGFRCAPETAPMNKMTPITIRPGATTAADRLICPFACSSPPPAAARTSAKVVVVSGLVENGDRRLGNFDEGSRQIVQRLRDHDAGTLVEGAQPLNVGVHLLQRGDTARAQRRGGAPTRALARASGRGRG